MGRLKTRAGTRIAALAAALAVLAMAAGAAVFLLRVERTRLGERLADEAQAAGLRAADGLRTLLGALEVQAGNGTANPRLVAALDAKVDEETLRDLLLNEPWWEPLRRSVDGFGLFTDETGAVVISKLPPGFEARGLLHDARTSHKAASGLVLVQEQVLAVTVAPVALTGRADWPLLVATR